MKLTGEQKAIIAKELNKLRKKHGNFTPDMVLEAATPEGSPLHDLFCWDDTEAARAWRLEQARRIVRVVVVKSEDATPRRAFVSIKRPHVEPEYTPRVTMLHAADLRAQKVAESRRDLRAWLTRYGDLTPELTEQIAIIGEALGAYEVAHAAE